MTREPVLIVSVLCAVGIALLQALGAGEIDSADDVLSIALPILAGFFARSQVTPAPRRYR